MTYILHDVKTRLHYGFGDTFGDNLGQKSVSF